MTIDVLKDTLNFLRNAIILILFSYVAKFFMDALYLLAADLTGGLNVSDVAFSMGKIVDKIKENLNKLKDNVADKAKDTSDAVREKGKYSGNNGSGKGDKGESDKGDKGESAPAPKMNSKDE
ncbi:MAG UNVERIFIED_CONTAM: hypothetical protein LVR18_03630 [Planctomycetaceae bacterium]|jgi:hypothetical protein